MKFHATHKMIVSLFLLFSVISVGNSSLFAKDYFKNRFNPKDVRRSTFKACLELLEQRNAKILVETGTSRYGNRNCAGDGCSTILFADWATDHNALLFSVDIDPNAIAASQEAASPYYPNVQFATQDSVSFLEHFSQQIDFLYLDSYDFDFNNPMPSQLHHLKEIKAAYPYLHKNTVIMIDDCDLPHGGKGKLVIEFLIAKGWKIFLSSYQTILIYPGS